MIHPLSFHTTIELLELDNAHMWKYIDYHHSFSDDTVFDVKDHIWFPLSRRISGPNDFIQYAVREHVK